MVAGQDSVLAAVYNGKIHWFWGDTTCELYPLGNFAVYGVVLFALNYCLPSTVCPQLFALN